MPKANACLFHRKQAKKSVIDHICDTFEVLFAFKEVSCITVNYHQVPLISLYPILVTLVKSTQIINSHGLFIVPSALLDMINQAWNGAPYIYKEIGQLDQR